MKASMKTCGAGNYFLIAILLVFFMLLYVYASKAIPQQSVNNKNLEKFYGQVSNTLQDPSKLVVIQGSTIPDTMPTSVKWDEYGALPSVDGSDTAPKSMFMFAYNKCSPSCCNKGSPYSCANGCVCMTDNQFNFLGQRGNNSKAQKCELPNEY